MRNRAAWAGLSIALAVMVLAFGIPHWLDWDVATRAPRNASPREVPPLHGLWAPKWFGPGTLFAVALAFLGWRYAVDLATRLPWPRLLLASYAASLGWLLALAFVDGSDGISRVLGNPYEYLETARTVDDVPALLREYTDRIPYTADDRWPTHVAGHPPGLLLVFVALTRIGLGGDLGAGLVVTAVAASIAPAVLVTLRALGVEDVARRAAPFLVLTPAAVFMAVSADALIGAVTAWGLACLALAATRLWWAVPAGLLLGSAVLMSYGMPLIGLVAVGVLISARAWRPLPVAALVALGVVLGFEALGFTWWEAYPVLRERYFDGIAADRPQSYWWWGNLAALLVAAGPLLGSGLATAAATAFSPARAAARVALWLVAGAALAVAAADASGMSKAEVERIWLPFVPWLTISCALLPDAWRRRGLGLQVVSALVVQHLLHTTW